MPKCCLRCEPFVSGREVDETCACRLANGPFGSFDRERNVGEYLEDQHFGATSARARGGWRRLPHDCSSGAGSTQPFEADPPLT